MRGLMTQFMENQTALGAHVATLTHGMTSLTTRQTERDALQDARYEEDHAW